MAPPSGNVSRPGRALAVLAALIVVMFLAIVGSNIGSPGQWGKDFKVHLGLDLTSGTTVALQAQAPKGVSSAQFAADMTQAKNIMANRVNGAGFTEAQVQQQGSDIINVAVPGAGSQKVVNLVGTTAQLLFREVLLEAPNKGATTRRDHAHADPVGQRVAVGHPVAPASRRRRRPRRPARRPRPGPWAAAAAGGAAAKEMASRSHHLTAAHAKASATPSASGSASPSASASATPSPASSSGVSTVAGASGDASLVSAAGEGAVQQAQLRRQELEAAGRLHLRSSTTTPTSRPSRAAP